MKLLFRRILYSIFIIIFIIAVPIIILYTSGYRYNPKINQLQKTGILIIETDPKGAAIYMNNNLQAIKTPAKFKTLLPDDYMIKLEKPEYYEWTKKLKVKSSFTTFANNVILFKKSLPILEKNGNIVWLNQVPRQNKFVCLIYVNDSYVIDIFEPENQNGLTVYESPDLKPLVPQNWSPNNKKLLVQKGKGEYLIINTETNTAENLYETYGTSYEKLDWDKNNNSILYGLNKNLLYQIDLLNKGTKSILADHISDFMVKGQEIYYITKKSDGFFINRSFLGLTNPPDIIKLPTFSEYKFKNGPDNLLTIQDLKNNEIIIVETKIFGGSNDEPKNIFLQQNAKEVSWSKDFQKAIFYNDFEIWGYDLVNNNKYLITRLGQEIKNAIWHPSNNYIVYIADQSLNIIELGFEDPKNNWELVNASWINNDLYSDRQGKFIYFIGQLGNQKGIFSLNIR